MTEDTLEEKQKKKYERKQERRESDLRRIMQLPEGRRILRWIVVEKCGTMQDPWRMETNLTNYNLGRQSIGRDLLNDITKSKADAFSQIEQEYQSELQNEFIQEQRDQENTSVLG